jgi:hypothetical protein
MDEKEDDNDYEPIEKSCESCGGEGYIDDMVDCPLFEEDLEEKGAYPGWIHKSCCEDEFVNDPENCIEYCDNEKIVKNIKLHFENCVNLEGLVKKISKNDVPIFVNEDNSFYITTQADKLLEPFKPLNIVTGTFSDEETGIFYVKDNLKNIIPYSTALVNEILDRFSKIDAFSCEMFCIPKGPFCIVYQIGELSIGAMLAPRDDEVDVPKVGIDIATRWKAKYSDAESFFGVEIRPNRENLKTKIQALSEDELINVVLVPILCAQGFLSVKPISFHGPGESGGDFHPFYKIDEFGKIVYYSAQIKAVKIHANAGIKEGNVNQLINQMDELFRTTFKSFNDNAERKITRAFIFSSKDIASDARNQLFFEYENRQLVSLVEIDDIVTAILEKGLADQILSYRVKKENN